MPTVGRYDEDLTDTRGNARIGASVLVRTTGGATATLYTDDTGVTAAANPVNYLPSAVGKTGLDALGNLVFYAVPAAYDLVVTPAGRSTLPAVRVVVPAAGAGGGGAPSGPAGGVLAGTYPDPSFAVDMATQAELDAEALARANADALLIPLTQKGTANGVATLGADSKVPAAQIPAIALSEYLGAVASQAAMLALVGQRGDWCTRTDLAATFVLAADDPTQLASWVLLPTPADAVLSVAGRTGAVVLAKADVGLGNVDNTTDANKPVSTAQQTALDAKVALAGSTSTGEQVAPSFKASGKTGATATPVTLAGGTASGAPTTGAHIKGELVLDDTGAAWYCTVSGTPGTWVQSGGGAAPTVPTSSYVVPLFAGMAAKGFWTTSGGFNPTGAGATLNQGVFVPVMFDLATQLDRIGVKVMTAAASAVFRLGLYADNSGLPSGALVQDFGTVSAAATDVQLITIAWTPQRFVRYWFCLVLQGAAGAAFQTLNAQGTGGPTPFVLPTYDFAGGAALAYDVPSFATGALPGTGPALSVLSGSNTPARLFARTS